MTLLQQIEEIEKENFGLWKAYFKGRKNRKMSKKLNTNYELLSRLYKVVYGKRKEVA